MAELHTPKLRKSLIIIVLHLLVIVIVERINRKEPIISLFKGAEINNFKSIIIYCCIDLSHFEQYKIRYELHIIDLIMYGSVQLYIKLI